MSDSKAFDSTGIYGCSVSRTLDVIGDAWGFLVLRSAFFGARRFEAFAGEVAASRGIISARLERFVANGVFERRCYSSRPQRFEYRFTEKGRAMYPIFVAMMLWGDRWGDWPEGPPLVLTHRPCGGRIGAETICDSCSEPVTPQTTRYRVADPEALRAGPPETRLRRASNPENFLRGRECSVAQTLKLFGDRWSLLILRDAFLGQRRYDEFQGSLGIASNILANRLQSLCEAGVLEKLQYQSGPDRFEYRLSESGLDFHKSLLTMIAWGDRWIFGRETAPPVELTHRLCGARLHPRLACATCGQEIDARDVDYAYVRPQSLGPRGEQTCKGTHQSPEKATIG